MSDRCARRDRTSWIASNISLICFLGMSLATTLPVAARAEPEGHPPESADVPAAALRPPAAPASGASDDAPPSSDSTPPPDVALPQGYDEAIDRAVDEYERGHFEEAREHFRTAHQIFPNARTLRGLGKVEFELRNYGESVKFLTAALASSVRPLSPDLRDEVRTLLRRARAYVGEVHVDVQPGSATVSVDGITVATGPQAALALQVGDHVLEFRAAGRLPERRQVRVHGGDQLNVQVVLPSPEATTDHHLAPERDTASPPAYKKWWVWTAAAVLAAGATTAAVLATRGRDPKTRSPAPGSSPWIVVNP